MVLCGYKIKGYIDYRTSPKGREYAMHKVSLKDLCMEQFTLSKYLQGEQQQLYKIIKKHKKEINAYIEGVKDGSIVQVGKNGVNSSERTEINLIVSEHDALIILSAKWKKEHSNDSAPMNNPYEPITSRKAVAKGVGRKSARTGTDVVKRMVKKGLLSDTGRVFKFPPSVKMVVAEYFCEQMCKISTKNLFEDKSGRCFIRFSNIISIIPKFNFPNTNKGL